MAEAPISNCHRLAQLIKPCPSLPLLANAAPIGAAFLCFRLEGDDGWAQELTQEASVDSRSSISPRSFHCGARWHSLVAQQLCHATVARRVRWEKLVLRKQTSLQQRIIDLVQVKPGLTAREITDILLGKGEPLQSINGITRMLARGGHRPEAAAHAQLHRLANQRRIAGVIGARPSSRAIAKHCVRADRALMRAARGAFNQNTKSERSYGHAQPFRTRPPDHDALRATAA